jgi:hypothetical protein
VTFEFDRDPALAQFGDGNGARLRINNPGPGALHNLSVMEGRITDQGGYVARCQLNDGDRYFPRISPRNQAVCSGLWLAGSSGQEPFIPKPDQLAQATVEAYWRDEEEFSCRPIMAMESPSLSCSR